MAKKFDSEKEKKDYFRKKQAERRQKLGHTPREGLTEIKTGDVKLSDEESGSMQCPVCGGEESHIEGCDGRMTETDAKFEALRPGYYVYDRIKFDRICLTCFRRFDTRMNLLKFCDPVCQKEKLESLSTTCVKQLA